MQGSLSVSIVSARAGGQRRRQPDPALVAVVKQVQSGQNPQKPSASFSSTAAALAGDSHAEGWGGAAHVPRNEVHGEAGGGRDQDKEGTKRPGVPGGWADPGLSLMPLAAVPHRTCLVGAPGQN